MSDPKVPSAPKPVCPRDDCENELEPDPFLPPGALACPKHGTMRLEAEPTLQLSTRLGSWDQDFVPLTPLDRQRRVFRTELETLVSWLARLAEVGTLRFSTVRDQSGESPTELVIENLPLLPSNRVRSVGETLVDVVLRFDPRSRRLIGVLVHEDPRSRANRSR